MEAIRSTETPALTRSARPHIPEDGILRRHRREKLKSCIEIKRASTGQTRQPVEVPGFQRRQQVLQTTRKDASRPRSVQVAVGRYGSPAALGADTDQASGQMRWNIHEPEIPLIATV
jgi:hypothetical protein